MTHSGTRSGPAIAIAGATGLVGSEMIAVIDQLKVPFSSIRLLASNESAGELYRVGTEEVQVEVLTERSFEGIDIALFATSAELSAKFVPIAVKAGAIAIDNSRFYRLDPNVPLVVPEVNMEVVGPQHRIIANPNCSTIQMMPVLAAINKAVGLKRVVVSTYQSASGAGKAALDELWSQLLAVFNQRAVDVEVFPHQLGFNVVPQVDVIEDDGYTREERKIVEESRKILGLPDLKITATAVRVPVLHCHSESVNVETEREISLSGLVELLAAEASLSVYGEWDSYPMPLNVVGTDEIHVGRIRRDPTVPCGFNLWIVADNVRKGAALNAVQIAQALIARPQIQ